MTGITSVLPAFFGGVLNDQSNSMIMLAFLETV